MTSQTEMLKTVENWAQLYFFRSLTDFFNHLKRTELSLLQAYALTYLYFKGPIKISDLCEHMMVSPGAASQMVDRLEKLEMVERVADPDDRRVRKVLVCPKGEQFVKENFIHSQNWLGGISTDLSSEQQEQIATALVILLQNMGNTQENNKET